MFFFSNVKGGCQLYDSCYQTRVPDIEGWTLARTNQQFREILDHDGCKFDHTVLSLTLKECADLASEKGFIFFTHGVDANSNIHCAFYTECTVASYGPSEHAHQLYELFTDKDCGVNGNNYGPELKQLSAGSACACQIECGNTAGCEAWTYIPVASGLFNMGSNDCTLRSAFGQYIDNCNGQCKSGPKHSVSGDAYKEVGDVGEMLSIQGPCNSNKIGHAKCRQKSEAVFQPPKPSDSSDFNGLLWSFGQFVDHDLDLVPEVKTDIVHIPYDADKDFEFHRAESHCPNGQFGNRRNAISARIDLSQVYGSTTEQEDTLRDPIDRTKMKMGSDDILPSDDKTIFLCGDARCGENPFLTSQHTLWVKHHNVIVDELIKSPDNTLSGDDLYEAAKQMNIATYQRIVDREFVPALVGPTPAAKYWRSGDWISHVYDSAKISIGSLYLNENEGGVTLDLCREMVFGLHACKKQYLSHGSNGECVCATVQGSTFLPATSQWKTYEINKDVICPSQGDMSISSLFANAAYRLHHLVNDEFFIGNEKKRLKDGHFLSKTSYAENGKLDAWFQRLLEQKSHKFGNHMADSLQHALFSGPEKSCDEKTKDNCRDLAALNCLRGIDVGLPTYNEVREMFGLPQREDFVWSENACTNQLGELYDYDIDQVELFMGGSCEEPVSGAVLGETFLVIVKDQFLRLRDNDPNWIAFKSPGYTYREVIERCTNLDTSLFHGQASFLHKDTPGFVTPQKPTQGEFLLKIQGLQGAKENVINKKILDQDTIKITEL